MLYLRPRLSYLRLCCAVDAAFNSELSKAWQPRFRLNAFNLGAEVPVLWKQGALSEWTRAAGAMAVPTRR